MESHTRVGGHIVAGGIPGESGIISTRTSCCSHSTMPTRRITETLFGKMPTTSVRRRISLVQSLLCLGRPDLSFYVSSRDAASSRSCL